MVIIDSDNVYLFPLTKEDLNLWLINPIELEKKLSIRISEKNLSPLLKTVYNIKIDRITNDEKNYLFYTYFAIVLKSENTIIGSIGFKGLPDHNNSCEVGYGLDETYRNRGFMKEALYVFTKWAFQELKIDFIRAETLKDNYPSHKVLNNLNAKVIFQDQNIMIWKIEP